MVEVTMGNAAATYKALTGRVSQENPGRDEGMWGPEKSQWHLGCFLKMTRW